MVAMTDSARTIDLCWDCWANQQHAHYINRRPSANLKCMKNFNEKKHLSFAYLTHRRPDQNKSSIDFSCFLSICLLRTL